MMKWARILFFAIGFSPLVGGCGRSTGGDGSETHWLAHCQATSDCEQGECLCGVCTVSCDSISDCPAPLNVCLAQTPDGAQCVERICSAAATAPPSLSNCDDAATPVRLADIDPGSSTTFEVRGTSMLVATQSDGSVRLIDLATRSVRTLAAGRDEPYEPSMSAKFAYWTDLGPTQGAPETWQLVRAPLDGSSPAETIAINAGSCGPLVDGDDVYFAQDGALAKISEGGGTLVVLANANEANPLDLAVAGDHIYWSNCGLIQRVPKAGGSVETLAEAYCPLRISTDETDVFFPDTGVGGVLELWRVPLSGGGAMLIDSAAKGGYEIAVDETYVYLAGEGISRIPKSGGAAELVEEGTIADVAVDKSCLYWADTDQGAIFVAKK
jgi:hypothetical protein